MSFIVLFVGRRLINMWEGQPISKCIHVSLKILDPGIQDVASLTPSSEGEDTKDKDVKGKIPAGTAAPGGCFILSYFFVVLITTRPRC